MLDVKHLVVENVLDEPFGYVFRVQCLAYRDAVVNAVVMPKDASGSTLRPGDCWPRQFIPKEPTVELRKDLLQIVDLSMSCCKHFSTVTSTRDVGRTHYIRC